MTDIIYAFLIGFGDSIHRETVFRGVA